MISTHTSLAVACGSGQLSAVEMLVDMEDTDLEALGTDGASPLCAAATWGYNDIVKILLDAGCDANVRNGDKMRSTALHVACCQEHGKIVHLLLSAGADAMAPDSEQRTPVDFASASEMLWPLFAARGLKRTEKQELVRKRILRKVDDDATERGGSSGNGGGGGYSYSLPYYSRPGSAYVSTLRRGGGTAGRGGSSGSMPSVSETVDPLGEGADVLGGTGLAGESIEAGGEDGPPRGHVDLLVHDVAGTRSLPRFSMWRDG